MGRKAMKYLIKVSQPTSEPITLAEAQLHLRLDTAGSPPAHPDDALVQAFISASRENAESYTGVTIAACDYEAQGTPDDSKLSLQTHPVTSVSSVTYEDSDGVTQTVDAADYYVDNFSRPSVLVFKQNAPVEDVTVRFRAGYTDTQSPNPYPTPAAVKAAILVMLGNLYENRESVSSVQSYERPQSALFLLTPYRINMGL
jgi:uncharacterized phiE125 gp8 family phage protein